MTVQGQAQAAGAVEQPYALAAQVMDLLPAFAVRLRALSFLERGAIGPPRRGLFRRTAPSVTVVTSASAGVLTPSGTGVADALRPLVERPALRREVGAASRAYVEQVHDIDRVADRLIAVYRSL